MGLSSLLAVPRRLVWSNAVAQSQRKGPQDTDRPAIIAVASLSEQMLTTPTTAVVANVLSAAIRLPVVAIDADGLNQPLRGPLGAGDGGDLEGLTTLPGWGLRRTTIETHADTAGSTVLLSTSRRFPQPLEPETLLSAVRRAAHRWPVAVIDLPFTCGSDVIATGTSMATHVLLLADKFHTDHAWLYQRGHHLSDAARQGRVSVVKVGATPSDSDAPDTLTLPSPKASTTARDRVTLPTDPVAVIQYNRLLTRLYPEQRPGMK